MRGEAGSTIGIDELRGFTGRRVLLRLVDGTEHRGVLRTELLGEQSISIFIFHDAGDGATVYIDEIAAVDPQP